MKKQIAAIAGSVLLLIGCAGEPPAPEPPAEAPSSSTMWIAFNVLLDEADDDYEVFVMRPDGSDRRNLTQSPGVEWVYLAQDDRLYFVSDREQDRRKYNLFEMRSDGSGLRRITPFLVRDSWMGIREGGEMVVASVKDGGPELYLIDRDGNELSRLTTNDLYDNDPTFSPDGRRIAWRSKASGIDELWVMDADGTNALRLTSYPADDPARDEHAYHAGPPRWHPVEDRISFCSKRGGSHAIYWIRPDGSDLERITDGTTDECWHDWSPDGALLAYDGKSAEGNYDIYVRTTETGETRRLTHDPQYEQAPVFVQAVD